MKLSKIHLIVVVLLIVQVTKSQTKAQTKVKDDSTVCLQIIGITIEKNIPIDGVVVKLYKENEELHWEEITSVVYHEHSFSFNLIRNTYYTVEVSKKGYVTRSIGISTALPDNVIIGDVKFTFEFELELFKEKQNVDDYYLDFPVALIKYNETNQVFEYDTKYTKHIKSKINETTGMISPSSTKPK